MRFTVPANDAGSLDEMLRTLKPVRLDRYDAAGLPGEGGGHGRRDAAAAAA
jgi:hypothetical protein